MDSLPRLAPDRPLPPYTYIPGRTPHPVSDPAGHLHGESPEPPPPLDPQRWRESAAYLFGIDLFNHGYYWEAHEVWEGLWHAAGRKGPHADFLKALIRFAAAGTKAREGNREGLRSHARAVGRLVAEASPGLGGEGATYAGLSLSDLEAFARLAEGLEADAGEDLGVRVVFPFVLHPQDPSSPS